MTDILISIQPKWCEKIANGEKTIEIRKTRPKLETPFKVYIYCTKGKFEVHECLRNNLHYDDSTIKVCESQGKVIGEFVCDRIELINPAWRYLDARCVDGTGYILGKACLTSQQLLDYGQGKLLYAWHISDLKIYDKPKGIHEFCKPCGKQLDKKLCDYCHIKGRYKNFILKKPPQSWCYVEVRE